MIIKHKYVIYILPRGKMLINLFVFIQAYIGLLCLYIYLYIFQVENRIFLS